MKIGSLCLLVVILGILLGWKTEAAAAADNKGLPVLLMHGIGGNPGNWDHVIPLFKQQYPDRLIFALDVMNGLESFINPIFYQIERVQEAIEMIKAEHQEAFKDGYILVGHSQGALISSNLIKTVPNHGVKRFISLAGPLNGQYGIPGNPQYVPEFLWNVTAEEVYLLLYNAHSQNHVSFANYWKDPEHFDDYLRFNSFLPVVQNETFNPLSHQYKKNFLQVQDIYLFASSHDDVIKPWWSGLYGFWDKAMNRVDMVNQEIYQKDSFGLKTMDEQKRLHLQMVPGLTHNDWRKRTDIIKKYLLPLLDI